MRSDISNKLQTDVIYLDFQEAFESVPYDKALIKLWSRGITGNVGDGSRPISLSSKFQLVSVNWHHPNTLPVTSVLPHAGKYPWSASKFLVFITDKPTLVKTACRLLLFADDTKLSVWNLLTISLTILTYKVMSILSIPGDPPISPSAKKKIKSFTAFKVVPVLFPLITS